EDRGGVDIRLRVAFESRIGKDQETRDGGRYFDANSIASLPIAKHAHQGVARRSSEGDHKIDLGFGNIVYGRGDTADEYHRSSQRTRERKYGGDHGSARVKLLSKDGNPSAWRYRISGCEQDVVHHLL